MPIPVIVWVVAKGVVVVGARVAARQVAKTVAKKAAEAAVKKVAKESAAQVAKKGAQVATKVSRKKGSPTTGNTTGRTHEGKTSKDKKKGPCDHLRQGNGKGPYRGGAHGKTKNPKNDGKDSHHMPADDVSPLKKNVGPAIQMEPEDHAMTSSNGKKGAQGARYRAAIGQLLKDGKWREAMTKEIKDIRKIARAIGSPRKYNEAMLEMVEYFKCLEKNNLLPKVR